MSNSFVGRYCGAFIEVLFMRLRSDNIKSLSVVGRVFVYAVAFVLFYLPILHFAAVKCVENHELIVYAVIIAAIHVLAKFMLSSSKKIQQRFATVKRRERFFMRTWLVVEYVVFMWIVYLFYPLVCIFIPFALLAMSLENMLGYSLIFNLLLQNSEMFVLVGGMISYVVFIVADGYRKLRSGFLPDYLVLFVILTVISSSVGGFYQKIVEYIDLDVSQLAGTLSWIFSVSNRAMNAVASVMALLFAIHSLYKNCGTGGEEEAGKELPVKEAEDENSSRPELPLGRR